MKKEFSKPSIIPDRLNEDYAGTGFSKNNEPYAFVIDGATPLTGRTLIHDSSDAYFLTEFLQKELHYQFSTSTDSTELILTKILKDIKVLFDNAALEKGVEIDYPSASISVIRVINDVVTTFRLGDCLTLVKLTNNKLHISKEIELCKLDSIAIKEQVQKSKEAGISVREARPLITETLLKHRNLLNVPGGYWNLEPTAIGIPYAEKHEFPLTDVLGFTCMTDGFSSILETYSEFSKIKTHEELYNSIRDKDLEELYEIIRKIEKSDSDFEKFPRFKHGDDLSVAFVQLKD